MLRPYHTDPTPPLVEPLVEYGFRQEARSVRHRRHAPLDRRRRAALEPHEARRRALVGLLTGNVAPGAALKLRSAGLDPARFRIGAYGSDSARRTELPAVAAARAAALTGATFTGSDVIIVGDTPDDVACGGPIGARSLAGATRPYDVAPLRATRGTYVSQPLAEPAAVLDAIFA